VSASPLQLPHVPLSLETDVTISAPELFNIFSISQGLHYNRGTAFHIDILQIFGNSPTNTSLIMLLKQVNRHHIEQGFYIFNIKTGTLLKLYIFTNNVHMRLAPQTMIGVGMQGDDVEG
jgi:hypothetical protein